MANTESTETHCGWCGDELDANRPVVQHPEYGVVCADHPELTGADVLGDPDAAYEIALDALLGVG